MSPRRIDYLIDSSRSIRGAVECARSQTDDPILAQRLDIALMRVESLIDQLKCERAALQQEAV